MADVFALAVPVVFEASWLTDVCQFCLRLSQQIPTWCPVLWQWMQKGLVILSLTELPGGWDGQSFEK